MDQTEDIYTHFESYDPNAAPRQPLTILQQLPVTVMPPGSAASIRPGGRVKEDLVELMMIQNAQMHQVIMNSMTMSALSWSGSGSLSGHEAHRALPIIQENEADPEIYHHYYQAAPYLLYPAWLLPQATQVCLPSKSASSAAHRVGPAVPPPPPLNSPGTVGADITPPAENQDVAEAEEEKLD